MPRLFLIAMPFFAITVSLAVAHPARPLYVPPPPQKGPTPPPPLILNGTSWEGKYLASKRIFTFEPDGTVSYKSTPAAKNIKNKGHWRFDGENLYFEHFIVMNNVLMQYHGKVQDANTIIGESITKSGGKTKQTLKRK